MSIGKALKVHSARGASNSTCTAALADSFVNLSDSADFNSLRAGDSEFLVDIGTATTIEVIDANANFLGGAIIPGIRLSLEALSNGTSKLPSISISVPDHCIGTNTFECMQSGSIFGAASLIDGMIARMEEELGASATVVATGGLASLIVPHCKREILYDENLLLRGLAIIYQKNKKQYRDK